MMIALNNTILHPNSKLGIRENGPGSQPLTEKPSLQNETNTKNYNINATARENTRGRMSFKGSSVQSTIIEKTPKWVESMAKQTADKKILQKGFQWIGDNVLMGEAIIALFLTCVARPATILATPTKDPENKQKNKYAAVKSAASGIVGLVTTYLVSQPFKAGTEETKRRLKEANQYINTDEAKPLAKYIVEEFFGNPSPSKIFDGIEKDEVTGKELKKTKELLDSTIKKAKELVNDSDLKKLKNKILTTEPNIDEKLLQDTMTETLKENFKRYDTIYKSFLNKINGPIFWPFKAAVTVALVPVILKALGVTKTAKKPGGTAPTTAQNNTEQQKLAYQYQAQLLTPQNTNKIFQNFAGVQNNENK